MLWKCLIMYDGTNEYVEEIRFSEGSLVLNTHNIKSSIVEKMKYVSTHDIYSPFFFKSELSNVLYLMPGWIEVHPQTTLDDVTWIKPKRKSKAVKVEDVKVGDYTIKFNEAKNHYTCSCQGFWRVKDKKIGCKHIQGMKK